MALKIGIIGYGYVGKAVAASYPTAELFIYDPKHTGMKHHADIAVIRDHCDAIFVCVPTPQCDTGECDTSIINNVLSQLTKSPAVVICKSTAPPEYYWVKQNDISNLAHVPEFLTQARAEYDYVNPHKIVVGCEERLRDRVADILMGSMINFERVKIEYCSIAEASFFKYLANNMLAIKVVMNNEFAELATSMGLSWDTITSMAKNDSRLGTSHWCVSSDDGEFGFAGACFPKDTQALSYQATKHNVDTSVLNAAIIKNNSMRSK